MDKAPTAQPEVKDRPILGLLICVAVAAMASTRWTDPRPFWAAVAIIGTVAALARAALILVGMAKVRRAQPNKP